jgi:hypothetical protein
MAMAEQRWWIRSYQEPGRPDDWRTTWHLERAEGEGTICRRDLRPPLERVTDTPGGDPFCGPCVRSEQSLRELR